MSTIERLSIQGIRSFSSNDACDIRFQTPLTVIVGHNGAGKTTIIECLRYVTTGELPPNSKSGVSFVLDPKLAKEREVKAQVKLRFTNVSGKSMVCSRRLQVTQTAKKASCKTIESTLLTIDPVTGEKQSISSKCADMDRLIPIELGVSKAVLENVIFCHQEESSWPLSEPKKLKEKFDDIFAATRYIKALENIKKFRDEQVKDVREKVIELEHLEKCRDAAQEKRRLQQSVRAQMQAADEAITGIDAKLEPINKLIAGLDTQMAKFNALQQDRAAAESAKDQLVKNLAEIKGGMTNELTETDAELAQMEKRFDEQFRQAAAQRREAEQQQKQANDALEALRAEFNRLLTQGGRAESELDALSNRVKERDALIQTLANKYRIDGYRTPEELAAKPRDAVGQEFRRQLERVLSARRATIEADRARLEGEVAKLGSDVDARRNDLSIVSARFKSKDEEVRDKKNRAARALDEAKSLCGGQSSAAKLEQDLAKEQAYASELEVKVAQLKQEADNPQPKAELRQTEASVATSQQRLQQLDKELESINSELGARAQLDLKRQQRDLKQNERETMLRTREQDFATLIPGFSAAAAAANTRDDNLSSALAQLLERKTKLLKEEQTRLRDAENEHARAKAQLEVLHSEKKRATAQRDAAQAELNKVLAQPEMQPAPQPGDEDAAAEPSSAAAPVVQSTGNPDLDQRLTVFDRQKSKTVSVLATLDAAELMYSSFIKKAEQSHACPLCERAFGHGGHAAAASSSSSSRSSLDEFDKFMQTYKNKLSVIPGRKANLATQLNELQALLQRLDTLRPLSTQLTELVEKTLPRLESSIEDAAAVCEVLGANVDDLAASVAEQKESVDLANQLRADAAALARLSSDVRALDNEIAAQERTLQSTGGSGRSRDQVSEERKSLAAELEMLRRSVSQLTRDIRAKEDAVNAERNRLFEVTKTLASRVSQLEEAKRRFSVHEELVAAARVLGEELETIQLQHKPAEERLRTALDARETSENALKSANVRWRDETATLTRDSDAFKTLEAASMMLAGKEAEVARLAASKAHASRSMADKEQQVTTLQEKVASIRRQVDREQSVRRNLQDNISFRRKKIEVQQCDEEMANIDDELKQMNVGILATEKQVPRDTQRQLQSERAKLEGQRATWAEQDKGITRELQTPLYNNVDDRFRKQLITVKTTKMANHDLEQYHKALDKAVMKYHAMKMQEINEIIRELWANTYKGADIDAIEIRSDVDEEETQASGRKSYNYRVVMVKGEMEMDIRGRCSAGQKVLACLIIRMALSETFCLNCGILALDEPTTNLDKDNIDSLAHALAKLVESRRAQHNFQLLVITHDEDFVAQLGRSETIQTYFRVEKDFNQTSRIIPQQFSLDS
ncbi:zinc ion binding protein [Capsaspora owczarzaki ATCC 30864]|uniref:Zinc ion binding protein n=1 Tax=Capsaspora owczarzaki (strain ATCC 30864) TaxID=595528 RepID=A0A0D2WNZ4_CAPO3|nr:zinc ion binding protein [Capsaspora owczarzaki ATCC 30864]